MIIMRNKLLLLIFFPIVIFHTIDNTLIEYLGQDGFNDCPSVLNKVWSGQFTGIWYFSVPELKDVCVERCANALFDCILNCKEDSACLSNCIRVEIECVDGESSIEYNIFKITLKNLGFLEDKFQ